MAKITDPDGITSYIVNGSPTTEVLQFNTTAKTIKLIEGGGFTFKDGVTGQCLFSKIKEVIKASSLLISVPLPVREMIHDESMELINGWTFADANTRKAIRDCGVAYVNTSGVITDMYACFVTLGEIATGTSKTTDLYFVQSNSPTATANYFEHLNTATTFGVNELVSIYSGSGSTDLRAYAKVFLRRAGYTYDESSNADIGYTELTFKKYNFPISHAVDAAINGVSGLDDTSVDAFTGMSITWGATTGVYLGSYGPYAYHVTIQANSYTHQQIYAWVQRQLRKDSDIDADSGNAKNGNVAAALVFMDGSILTTIYQAGVGGVHIASPASSSWNYIKERDDSNVLQSYPLSVSVIVEVDDYLWGDVDSYFWIFETTDYGTAGSTPLLDATSAEMKGSAYHLTNNQTSFAYTYASNLPLTGVALGIDGAKIAIATGTLTPAGIKLVFVAGLERWYSDPA